MLFDTEAEYRAEMAEVRALMKKAMKEQGVTRGGPGDGQHTVRGTVRDHQAYLELLSKELYQLLTRTSGGTVNRAVFGRES